MVGAEGAARVGAEESATLGVGEEVECESMRQRCSSGIETARRPPLSVENPSQLPMILPPAPRSAVEG
ncbi:hypothetical protein GCM10027590_48170 [Nocardiopsis nanhaiensis]